MDFSWCAGARKEFLQIFPGVTNPKNILNGFFPGVKKPWKKISGFYLECWNPNPNFKFFSCSGETIFFFYSSWNAEAQINSRWIFPAVKNSQLLFFKMDFWLEWWIPNPFFMDFYLVFIPKNPKFWEFQQSLRVLGVIFTLRAWIFWDFPNFFLLGAEIGRRGHKSHLEAEYSQFFLFNSTFGIVFLKMGMEFPVWRKWWIWEMLEWFLKVVMKWF